MTLSLLPLLLGTDARAVEPARASRAPETGDTPPPDAVDFASTLLALLGHVTRVEAGPATEEAATRFGRAGALPPDTAHATPWSTDPGGVAEGRPGNDERPAVARGAATATPAPERAARRVVGSNEEEEASTAPAALSPGSGSELAASSAAPPPGIRIPDRSPDRLQPELRDKVERVMERMRAEYGHDVELVEGYRSPERQRFLFAQGRTRPGAVVTWTRESLHTQGRAVDLRVDGTWDAPEAYAHLQRIAREEGLGTLGMKDPGHVELALPEEAEPSLVAPSGDSGARAEGSSARPARVARVAHVARVAGVAGVARVASPGASVGRPGTATASPRTDAIPSVPPALEVSLSPVPSRGPAPGTARAPATRPQVASETPVMVTRVAPGPATGGERAAARPARDEPLKPVAAAPAGPQPPEVERAPAPRAPVAPRAPAETPRPAAAAPAGPQPPEVERAPAPRSPVAAPAAVTVPPAERSASGGGDADSGDPRQRRDRSREEPIASVDRGGGEPIRAELRTAVADLLSRPTLGAERAVRTPAQAAPTDPMVRAERVLEAQEMARSLAPGRVSVRLDGGAGPVDQIKVGLLSRQVEAELDVSDAQAARRLRDRVSELHRALEDRGLELGALRVAGMKAGSETAASAWLGGRLDAPTADMLRALLGGDAAAARDAGRGKPQPQPSPDDHGSGSSRSRRQPQRERER